MDQVNLLHDDMFYQSRQLIKKLNRKKNKRTKNKNKLV